MKQAEAFLKELAAAGALPEDGSDTMVSKHQGALQQQIESRAVYLLGMREHGAKELKQKLITKFPETDELLAEFELEAGQVAEIIDDVLAHCAQEGWQSEERYIEQLIRNLAEKGQGPLKIRQKLQQTSSQSGLINAYLDWDDADWIEIAQAALLKKFGETKKPSQSNVLAKRMRFLQSRGFGQSVIWKAFT